MTDDQKRRVAGLCCFNMLGLVSTAAFMCAISSYAYCDFLTRTVTLAEGTSIDDVCSSTGFDNVLDPSCKALLNTHGVGFEGFWVTVPVDTQVCFSYTQLTPW